MHRRLVLVLILISVGIFRIGGIALIVLIAVFDPSIQRIVIARRIRVRLGIVLRLSGGISLRLVVIVLRKRRSLRCRVAMQRMHRRVLVFLRLVVVLRRGWRGFLTGALHP